MLGTPHTCLVLPYTCLVLPAARVTTLNPSHPHRRLLFCTFCSRWRFSAACFGCGTSGSDDRVGWPGATFCVCLLVPLLSSCPTFFFMTVQFDSFQLQSGRPLFLSLFLSISLSFLSLSVSLFGVLGGLFAIGVVLLLYAVFCFPLQRRGNSMAAQITSSSVSAASAAISAATDSLVQHTAIVIRWLIAEVVTLYDGFGSYLPPSYRRRTILVKPSSTLVPPPSYMLAPTCLLSRHVRTALVPPSYYSRTAPRAALVPPPIVHDCTHVPACTSLSYHPRTTLVPSYRPRTTALVHAGGTPCTHAFLVTAMR